MKQIIFLLIPLLCALVHAEEAGVLLQLGLGDKEPMAWDGSVKVTAGKLVDVSGWRFERQDHLVGRDGWQAGTRPTAVQGRANNPKKLGMAKRAQQNLGPIAENGVFVRLQGVTDESVVEVTTQQGNFSFKIGDVKYGDPLELLDGRAAATRTAVPGRQLSAERTEDDYPAIALGKKNRLYITYQSFTPGIDRDERAKAWQEDPGDLSFLAKPAGGDQLWLQLRDANKFDERFAVTSTGCDIYKSAVAEDGKGAAWVVWSERKEGAFSIFGRSFADKKLGEVVKLSQSAGNNLSPVAVTDAAGRVWVAWQGADTTHFAIKARHQTEAGWSDEIKVSAGAGDCWQPSIAAGSKEVAIAWDTYERGDFDVWLRTFGANGEGHAPQPVANSELYEARPSITYDKTDALWVAWEKSGPTWGKDFGAYDSGDGIGLYRDRQIALRVLKEGQWLEPAGALASALPGAQPKGKGLRNKAADFKTPPPPVSPETADGVNPDAFMQPAVRRGAPGEHAVAAGGWNTFNNLGRLACDQQGRIWCLTRTRLNSFRGPVGSTWVSYAAYLEGDHWVGPILIPHSDNLIYNLPAIVAGPQALLVAHASDHRMDRFAQFTQSKQAGAKGGLAGLDATKDPFDNDIYFTRIPFSGDAVVPVLKAAAELPRDNPPPSKRTLAERADIKAMHDYRATVAGKEVRILRGEFHRHTEISGDGAGDGPLEDMWRYGLDAASMDWLGNGDHDNGNGREYTWWLTQKTTDAFHLPGKFTPMFSYERSVSYPEGHRNCVFAQRGVRTLPRLPMSDRKEFAPAPDTIMLYKYLHLFGGICASHTSVGNMGTDWRNNDPEVEPMVEVYQGARQNYEYPGCPRCPTENDAIGGWEPAGFICNAFAKGYRFAFESSSDHGSTHLSYAMIFAEDTTREAILAAMKKRHTYGATDNIIAETHCKAANGADQVMGDEFKVKGAPTIDIKLIGTMPFAKITIVKDNVEVQVTTPNEKDVHFTWTDPKPEAGKTSYYYVRGEQVNSELVWCSPMWITLE
ncbi:MAG: hypothetical protein JWO94_904 [Verrucomicrobiaceae bacterium]|nr:hypothetical protein [Verrucomicrobiaceae bacterium]